MMRLRDSGERIGGIASLKRDQQNYLQAREHRALAKEMIDTSYMEHKASNKGVDHARPDYRMVHRIGRDAY